MENEKLNEEARRGLRMEAQVSFENHLFLKERGLKARDQARTWG